ncbi:unnamed protein product [Mycena citricolor]|uniref:Uncharacterized protein n=1 Tax=Mycena citricolor TaxID=2018698 RepID=A0AAD2H768_9AGAR|nr:unnamed protein product [Mycena citricolor]
MPAHLLITRPPPPPLILISIRANTHPLSPSPGHLLQIPTSGLAKPDSLHQGVLLLYTLLPLYFGLLPTDVVYCHTGLYQMPLRSSAPPLFPVRHRSLPPMSPLAGSALA